MVRGGWPGHSPIEATELFLPLLRDNGFDVRVEESPDIYEDADYLRSVDLILQCVSMGSATEEAVTGLRAAVAAGTGPAGWHGGIVDSYRDHPDYLQLVGGQFVAHPARTGVDPTANPNFVPHRIDIAKEHEIVSGIDSFEPVTEHYWVLTDDYNDVLATTTQTTEAGDAWHRDITSPAVRTRQWGDGHVFVATPGHDLDVLRQPEVRRIIERGLLWASR